jgi:hypothetical protein
MTLPEYLKSLIKEQKEAFAERVRALRPGELKVSIAYLYLLEKVPGRRPKTTNCWKYVEASDGAVTLEEIRPELMRPQDAA